MTHRAHPPSDRPGRRARTTLRSSAAVGVLFPIAAAFAVTRPALGQTPVRLAILDTAALLAPRLDESSGAAMSALVPGVVWTHNDSGDGPFLYATDLAGRDLGWVRVEQAHATDWEDLAAGPCIVAPGRCLYVGDIGDNHRRRKRIVVYRLREPRPPSGASDTLRTVPLLDSLVFRYPDRPHNAEALVVTGDGTILLVTKEVSGSPLLFRADARVSGGPRDLIEVGPLAMPSGLLRGRLVTGAAVAPGDSLLVVRTYVSLHFFRLRHGWEATPDAGTWAGIAIPVVEPQGEAVTFDGPDRLVLTSERGQAPRGTIVRLRIVRSPVPAARPTH